MIKRCLYLLVLWLYSTCSIAQERASKEILDSLLTTRGQAEVLIKYPGFSLLTEIGRNLSVSAVRDGMAVIVIAPGDRDYFLALDMPFYTGNRESVKAVVSATTMDDAMNWDKYPSYQQYDSIVHKLASDFPSICRVDTIGESIGGRLVLALKISDNVNEDEDEPEVFYSSTIHGDELVGYVLMLRLAEHILVNSTNGLIEQMLVDSLEIFINPLANPDGTYYGGDTISNPSRFNLNGKDLNRNFPDPTLPLIVQEPENIDMIRYMKDHQFVLSGNFHSGAEVLNFPWDKSDQWSNGYHADSSWFFSVCKQYVDTVHQYAVPGYLSDYYGNSTYPGVVRGDDWYIITGSRQDYVTYECQGREVTFELDINKLTDASQLVYSWEYNFRSLLTYLSNAFLGIHGRVTDKDTGVPVAAKLFIPGHDRDSSHVYSDTHTGKIVRFLAPGTYTLLFTADGYLPELVEGVIVDEGQQLWINVQMIKEDEPLDPGATATIKIWPVPATDHINIQIYKDFTGESEVSVISSAGQKMITETMEIFSKMPVQLDISNLAPGAYICRLRELRSGRTLSAPFIKR
ncbi:MAG: hypothetical protein E4G95_01750 [Bacteroidia bacterium]|nr:MAG: hypothetical protein E4G95_01750 [Bacteroidia bacterium]